MLSAVGEHDLAIVEAHRAHELDPLAPILGTTLGDAHFFARRYDEAVEWLLRTIDLDPGFIHPLNDLGRAYSQMGRFDDALAAFERGHEIDEDNPLPSVGIGYTLARAGRHDEARRILQTLEAEADRRYVSPQAIASVKIGLGEIDSALDWLERAYREHDRGLVWIKVHPRFDPLRGNPRFERIARLVFGER